ncbi:uncharacterized protein LOC119360839 [Triticum dicoccoides]|uniref:uncharacterized protein LOC119360839 n=1 Tax=Triticum dicoccoides TaxID=85692 RepID=UPI00188EBC52|nr:uncharacterized protein LOC119360839 [Triticum dicoccoides]
MEQAAAEGEPGGEAAEGGQGGAAEGGQGGAAEGRQGGAEEGRPGGAEGGPGGVEGGPGGAEGEQRTDLGWSAWADWQEGMDPEKVVHMLIAYCDPSKEAYEPIAEDWTDVQADNNTKEADDSYLCNPIPQNEHVGIDEEKMYLEKEPIPPKLVLFSGKEKDKTNVSEDESEDGSKDGSEDGSEEEPEVEEEELHELDHAPNIEYDQQDPPMTVGSTYPNMEVFKLALSQHAVKRDFEYNTEKSTQRRLRAYCKRRDEDDCPWRIHASTTADRRTVMVKKKPFEHDCSSTKRKKKVKNATKLWICEKVKDWLIEDATLGAMELRKKLKEHYKIKIHYKRVYMAGRPKTERYKGCSDKKRKKGKHLCPICKEYGHHWHNCKKGNPDDIAAMLAIREPPKKRAKTSKTAQSIVPCEDGAPTRMLFPPPSQSLETTTKKKRKHDNTESGGSKRSKTGSIENAKTKKKVAEKIPVPLDSPAMGTRSRKFNPPSPAMSTRSKRRLGL